MLPVQPAIACCWRTQGGKSTRHTTAAMVPPTSFTSPRQPCSAAHRILLVPPPPHAAHPMAPLWPVNKEARALPRASSVGHWLDSVSRGGKSAAHVACRCEELVATACSGAELGGSGHTRPPSAVPLRPAVALSTNAHTCLPRASAACALHGALGHAAAVPTAGPCSSGAARSAVRPEALAHDAWSMVNHAQAVGCTVCW